MITRSLWVNCFRHVCLLSWGGLSSCDCFRCIVFGALVSACAPPLPGCFSITRSFSVHCFGKASSGGHASLSLLAVLVGSAASRSRYGRRRGAALVSMQRTERAMCRHAGAPAATALVGRERAYRHASTSAQHDLGWRECVIALAALRFNVRRSTLSPWPLPYRQ
jgi:hypothetical protein